MFGDRRSGTVSRAASRDAIDEGLVTCVRCLAGTAALDAVSEAYHNPAAAWWGPFCSFRGHPGPGGYCLAGQLRRFPSTDVPYQCRAWPDMRVRRAARSMFERFTDRARRVVVLAQEEARKLNHNYIGTE